MDHFLGVLCIYSTLFITGNAGNSLSGTQNRRPLLPSTKYCGFQHSDDYVRSNNSTAINEFPWVAGLLYRTGEETETLCSGSLINNRYILTAAHCVRSTGNHTLIGVRLGEYNVKNQTDCVDDSRFYECSEEPKDFAIEKNEVHSHYNSRRFINDIALLRLNRSVTYSDYIRPICLPKPESRLGNHGDTLTASGWGKYIFSEKRVESKTKMLTTIITNEECLAANEIFEQYLTENHFCTKEPEVNAENYCHVDGGSPIMFSIKHQWYLQGVSSFRAVCQPTPYPQVHTKVVNYLNWITENIEP